MMTTPNNGDSVPIRWWDHDGIQNVVVDFNEDYFVVRMEAPRVGSYVRLIDLDSSAGWAYGEVIAVGRGAGEQVYVCTFRLVEGSWTSWPESFVAVSLTAPNASFETSQ